MRSRYLEILQHGSFKQYGFLQHHTHILTQEREWILTIIHAIKLYYSPASFIETRDQFDQCGFSASRQSYQGHFPACGNVQVNTLEDELLRRITKCDILKG